MALWSKLRSFLWKPKNDTPTYAMGVDLSIGPDRSCAVFTREVEGRLTVVHTCEPLPGVLAAGFSGTMILRSGWCPFCGERIEPFPALPF